MTDTPNIFSRQAPAPAPAPRTQRENNLFLTKIISGKLLPEIRANRASIAALIRDVDYLNNRLKEATGGKSAQPNPARALDQIAADFLE